MVNPETIQKSIILSGLFFCTVSDGYIVGQMSGMLAAQQRKDGDIQLNDNQMSWIASTIHATCIGGFAVAAIITGKFGRKKAITILSIPVLVNWIVVYYAEEMIVFMLSRVIVGVCFGGILSLSVLSTAEYTSPITRGFYLNGIVSAGSAIGLAIAHILGILLHWRTVALLGIIPAALSALLPCFWVESPTWLASKGRFEECKTAFRSLHGTGEGAEVELQLLIEVETCKRQQTIEKSNSYALKKLSTALRKRYFWKIAVLCIFLHIYRVATGRILISTFVITILQDLLGNTDILVTTFVIDGFLVLGAILSCYLIDKMKMRTLLFSSGFTSMLLLIVLSASLYFVKERNSVINWICASLLALYFMIISAGPYPLLEALFGEIFPLEIKTYCLFGFGCFGGATIFLSIQLALSMFDVMGYYGVFLFNAALSLMCLAYFWIALPETKGRTLQEIELYFKNGNFNDINNLLNEDQMKHLV